jgi:cytochrome c oxidase subunit 1
MPIQLWLWFIGMIVTTFPWHWVGILGMPRRMAYYDYTNPALAGEALPVIVSVVGALIACHSPDGVASTMPLEARASAGHAARLRLSAQLIRPTWL